MRIEDLLTEAAEDADQPLRHSVDDIVRRGRRTTRNHRIAAAATTVLTATAMVAGITAWSASRPDSVQPAGDSGQALTVDAETGKTIAPAPPASPLSDAAIIARCLPLDAAYLANEANAHKGVPDTGGPINGWKVRVKEGAGQRFTAVLVSPNGKWAASCGRPGDKSWPSLYIRQGLTPPMPGKLQFGGTWMRVSSEVRRVVLETPDGKLSAGRTNDGFLNQHVTVTDDWKLPVRVRGYDAQGKKVLDWNQPADQDLATVEPVR